MMIVSFVARGVICYATLCSQVGYFPSAFVTESEDDEEPFAFPLNQ